MSRPELTGPPELFYNGREAHKYTQNSRILKIQQTLSERALELLALPPGHKGLLLDIGCGSGLSGEVLTSAGHAWVGFDVSRDMLDVGKSKGSAGDLVQHDMGHGMPLRPGMFDGAISISAVQWLCYGHTKAQVPRERLIRFFQTLYVSLRRGARAVLQLYPESSEQMELITNSAMRCGFSGGLVVDYPHSTKAKKCYLTLMAGRDPSFAVPKGLDSESQAAGAFSIGRKSRKRHGSKKSRNMRDWVLAKKDRQRKQGKDVRKDSRYTARRRPTSMT